MTARNSYILLAQFLDPTQNLEAGTNLLPLIRSGTIDWKELLHQANQQLITPLWYLNIQRKDLLGELPQDLSEYLGELFAANRDRNTCFADVLEEVVGVCQHEGLSPVLLKGAAMYADNLYGDVGARIQTDLDLLLSPEEAHGLSERLQQRGYQFFEPEKIIIDNTVPSVHHHHLKMLTKPGTPVVVELHYRISRGRIGDVFGNVTTVPTTVAGFDCRMLAPEWRDLHNILHAMVSDRGTLQSLVPLKAVAESAWLRQRYPEADFKSLGSIAEAGGFGRDYHLYRAISQRLGLWPEDTATLAKVSTFRLNSCLEHGGSLTRRHNPLSLSLNLSLYKKFHFPRWAWNYICYMDRNATFWQRLKKLGSYLVRPASWKKV